MVCKKSGLGLGKVVLVLTWSRFWSWSWKNRWFWSCYRAAPVFKNILAKFKSIF